MPGPAWSRDLKIDFIQSIAVYGNLNSPTQHFQLGQVKAWDDVIKSLTDKGHTALPKRAYWEMWSRLSGRGPRSAKPGMRLRRVNNLLIVSTQGTKDLEFAIRDGCHFDSSHFNEEKFEAKMRKLEKHKRIKIAMKMADKMGILRRVMTEEDGEECISQALRNLETSN